MKNGYPDGYMWTGSGNREDLTNIQINPCFKNITSVLASISRIDYFTPYGYLSHLSVEVLAINNCSFTIQFATWGSCMVGTATAVWVAVGD